MQRYNALTSTIGERPVFAPSPEGDWIKWSDAQELIPYGITRHDIDVFNSRSPTVFALWQDKIEECERLKAELSALKTKETK